ncbi:Alanine racemase, catabolic [Rickettsiales bacterium Ac37b]|nr:Alanine racemase, catabolic [Rickettsiales bacterium Ac37b]
MTSYADAILNVDLNSIVYNYLFLKKKLNTVECGAVVKANAYGIGANHVASTLAKYGCKHFFVANLEEAISLRAILTKQYNIYVLHGVFPNQEQEFIHYNLTPILNDIYQIKIWNCFASTKKIQLPAILYIDTGLSRLGLTTYDALDLFYNQTLVANLNILYLMSHLSAADNPTHPLNAEQLKKMSIIQKYMPNTHITFVNSSGIFLGTNYHFHLARPGMALYGLNPTPQSKNPMHNVIYLSSKIIQVRNNIKQSPVGYGGSYYAERNSVIATVAIGYADGYFRSLSNNSICYINGYKAPVIGRVSMDLITLDVTNVPAHFIYPGQSVEIIGDNITVDQLAKYANTLGYEILTNLGHRFKLVYNIDIQLNDI